MTSEVARMLNYATSQVNQALNMLRAGATLDSVTIVQTYLHMETICEYIRRSLPDFEAKVALERAQLTEELAQFPLVRRVELEICGEAAANFGRPPRIASFVPPTDSPFNAVITPVLQVGEPAVMEVRAEAPEQFSLFPAARVTDKGHAVGIGGCSAKWVDKAWLCDRCSQAWNFGMVGPPCMETP